MPIRVLLAKPGLDGHDKGVRLVAKALMDAGMEVIYLGLRQSPESIAQAALQEDADVVGLSILSGAHLNLSRKVLAKIREAGLASTPVVVGGTIPPKDIGPLKDLGINQVFPVGTKFEAIVDWIRSNCRRAV